MGEDSPESTESSVSRVALWAASHEALFDECADLKSTYVRLEHFLDRLENPDATLERMATDETFARMLIRLFDQSAFLSGIIQRRPELADWLGEPGRFDEPLDKETLIAEIEDAAGDEPSTEDWMRVIRRVRQREISRIALRDIHAFAPVMSVTEDLANLADVMVEASYRFARSELEARFGEPKTPAGDRSKFAVIAMGKLGGRELNFSSDIDLLFVYDEDGETAGGRSSATSNAEFYSKLGEQIVRGVSEQTKDGYIFRVDMRLRPHGHMAPLATNIDHTLEYYERYGQAWERQALIKARACAGDPDLGEEFIRTTRHFAFPRYFDDETLEDVRNMKAQMEKRVESRGETDLEVKLGRGGIRDIEFTVQVLQLLNGGRNHALRTGRTLDAIEVLGEMGELGPLEAQTLERNYIFLRRVEHRLQIEGNQQVHALPKDPDALDRIAKKLGYESGPAFMNEYSTRADETRAILERFLAAKGDGNLWVADLLNSYSDGADGSKRLAELGFADVETARATLIALCVGSPDRPHSAHSRQQFAQILPGLVEAIGAQPRPNTVLEHLAGMLKTIKAPRAVYEVLRHNPALAEKLAVLAANSRLLTGMIVRDPGLFDLLGSSQTLQIPVTEESLTEQLDALRRAYDADAALYRLRDGETMRIGVRDLFSEAPFETIGRELTLLADCCLRDALATARERTNERYGETNLGFAVLGLGKAGGYELGYGSDLDLVFVCESGTTDGGMGAVQYFTDVAQRAIRILSDRTKYGVLYEVDARLRPYGTQGTLVVTEEQFKEYYEKSAESWERLALLKSRFMAGDTAFGDRIETISHDLAYSLPLDREAVDRIEEIGERLADQVSPLNIKKQRGGIAQIEWAVRMLQIRHAEEAPALRLPDFCGAVAAIEQSGYLSKEDGTVLRNAYAVLRRIENRIRMMDGKSASTLPGDPDDRADLAARLHMDGDLAEIVADMQARAYKVYQETIKKLSG